MHGHIGKIIKRIIIAAFWLFIWQMAAVLTDNDILLAGPGEVFGSLLRLAVQPVFWKTLAYSAGRISLGFLSAFAAGILCGALAYSFPIIKEVLGPAVSAMKAVPVAAFAVLLLIWSGTTGLTVWVSFLIVFPHIYAGTVTGLSCAQRQLLEMAQVFRAEWWKKWFFIYRPALMPYLLSCCKSALGMSWKSGVAAEVIGMPEFSIGERLYLSKIYLDTAGVLAWTAVIILLSLGMERLFLALLHWYAGRREPFRLFLKTDGRKRWAGKEKESPQREGNSIEENQGEGQKRGREREKPGGLAFREVSFGYGADPEKLLLQELSVTLRSCGRYCLMGPSGRGKTTWLRLAAGLEKPLKGTVEAPPGSMVFQEDRLCMQADAIWNVRMGRGVDHDTALDHLLCLMEEEDCRRPVSELSGGMRRRVALCRAVAAQGGALLLDEPFTGLDEANHRRAAEYICARLRGRVLVEATHLEEDAVMLDAAVIFLEGGRKG